MRQGWALLPLGLLLLAVAEIAVFVAVVHALGAGWEVVEVVAPAATEGDGALGSPEAIAAAIADSVFVRCSEDVFATILAAARAA